MDPSLVSSFLLPWILMVRNSIVAFFGVSWKLEHDWPGTVFLAYIFPSALGRFSAARNVDNQDTSAPSKLNTSIRQKMCATWLYQLLRKIRE